MIIYYSFKGSNELLLKLLNSINNNDDDLVVFAMMYNIYTHFLGFLHYFNVKIMSEYSNYIN